MDLITKNETILKLKCLLSSYTNKIDKQLSNGACVNDLLNTYLTAEYLLDVICRHDIACETIFNHSINIVKNGPPDALLTVKVKLGDIYISEYVGTGDALEIMAELSAYINLYSDTTGYISEYDPIITGETFTIRSCSPTIETLTVEYEAIPGSSINYIVDNVDPIIITTNISNCLEIKDICSIIDKINNLIDCKNCN